MLMLNIKSSYATRYAIVSWEIIYIARENTLCLQCFILILYLCVHIDILCNKKNTFPLICCRFSIILHIPCILSLLLYILSEFTLKIPSVLLITTHGSFLKEFIPYITIFIFASTWSTFTCT